MLIKTAKEPSESAEARSRRLGRYDYPAPKPGAVTLDGEWWVYIPYYQEQYGAYPFHIAQRIADRHNARMMKNEQTLPKTWRIEFGELVSLESLLAVVTRKMV